MKNKILALMITTTLVFTMAGCGKTAVSENSTAAEPQATEEAPAEESGDEKAPEEKDQAEATSSEETAPAKEDGQNPVMNFVGVYSTGDSREALVEAEGMENAKITVTCADSPWFHTQTVMSGHFDPETFTMEYKNAELTEYTYSSDGSVKDEKTSKTDSTGKAVFNMEENTLTITDESAGGNVETVFAWGPSSDMKTVSDPDHYAPVTAMDKAEIETVIAFQLRRAYLGENWRDMADMISYPITINGTKLDDSEAFLGFMTDKTIDESDRQAMFEETLWDMFVNGQGICMGSGQIWLEDPNYMTDGKPELKIIAINGITDRESEEDYVEETDRDFYATPSVSVYDEYGETHMLYEGSDGYWREEDGTAYSRISRKEFQLKDGTKYLKTYFWAPGDDEGQYEEDFYATPSVTAYDENDESYKLYEGGDGYWHEEDGTAYSRISQSEFQRKDGNKRLVVR